MKMKLRMEIYNYCYNCKTALVFLLLFFYVYIYYYYDFFFFLFRFLHALLLHFNNKIYVCLPFLKSTMFSFNESNWHNEAEHSQLKGFYL
jgi:hypothetical protein